MLHLLSIDDEDSKKFALADPLNDRTPRCTSNESFLQRAARPLEVL